MTKKEFTELKVAIKKILIDKVYSDKLKVMESLSKEFRQANNLEINKETNDFASKLKRSA
jgi:hypothetical protein